MKIDPGNLTTPAGAAQINETSSASTASAKRGASGSAASFDTVELSGPSRVLQSLASSRADKIAQLTQAVRNGTYSVSSQSISRALVHETLAGATG